MLAASTPRYPSHYNWWSCSSSSQGSVVRENCCSLEIRITPLVCRCLPFPKENPELHSSPLYNPGLRYGGPTEFPRNIFPTFAYLSLCPQCGEYHGGSSCSVSFLLFIPVRQDVTCLLWYWISPHSTLPRCQRKIPQKNVLCEVVTDPSDLTKFWPIQPRQHMAESRSAALLKIFCLLCRQVPTRLLAPP